MPMSKARSPNATELLKQDHRDVEALFSQFEKARSDSEKVSIVTRICRELAVHAEVEERIFYPESRGVLDSQEQEMVDEAYVEHASLKGLILRLDGMRAGDSLFKAYVSVLKEYVRHHVEEEEKEYFPEVEKSGLDLEAAGAEILRLKQELKARVEAQPMARDAVSAQLLPAPPLPRRAALKKTPVHKAA